MMLSPDYACLMLITPIDSDDYYFIADIFAGCARMSARTRSSSTTFTPLSLATPPR
jgi:hypothetical protein